MIPGLGEMLSRDVFGCRCHQCCTLSTGSLHAEPCQLPSERVVYLGPRQSRFSRSLGKSAAGPDTVTHTEKGNSEVCLTNCAPCDQLCPLEKGSRVAQADLESVYLVLLVIKPRNHTCSASILPTELHPSPCCIVKGEFCHRLPPVSETPPPRH